TLSRSYVFVCVCVCVCVGEGMVCPLVVLRLFRDVSSFLFLLQLFYFILSICSPPLSSTTLSSPLLFFSLLSSLFLSSSPLLSRRPAHYRLGHPLHPLLSSPLSI